MSNKKIKGIDLEDKEMRFFPIAQGLIQVSASEKGKQGYIKLHLPDEMLNDLMMMLGKNDNAKHDQYLVSCRVKS